MCRSLPAGLVYNVKPAAFMCNAVPTSRLHLKLCAWDTKGPLRDLTHGNAHFWMVSRSHCTNLMQLISTSLSQTGLSKWKNIYYNSFQRFITMQTLYANKTTLAILPFHDECPLLSSKLCSFKKNNRNTCSSHPFRLAGITQGHELLSVTETSGSICRNVLKSNKPLCAFLFTLPPSSQ